MEFEWNKRKVEENIKKHKGVGFNEATLAFYDKWAIEEFHDAHSDSSEKRFVIIGWSINRLLRVICTIRENELIRIISAEIARPFEERAYNENRNEYDR